MRGTRLARIFRPMLRMRLFPAAERYVHQILACRSGDRWPKHPGAPRLVESNMPCSDSEENDCWAQEFHDRRQRLQAEACAKRREEMIPRVTSAWQSSFWSAGACSRFGTASLLAWLIP